MSITLPGDNGERPWHDCLPTIKLQAKADKMLPAEVLGDLAIQRHPELLPQQEDVRLQAVFLLGMAASGKKKGEDVHELDFLFERRKREGLIRAIWDIYGHQD